uniref:Uncharacterized protein n=1 Tax=Setaria italica TaxID=4555 RepID=K3YWS0_SETIT
MLKGNWAQFPWGAFSPGPAWKTGPSPSEIVAAARTSELRMNDKIGTRLETEPQMMNSSYITRKMENIPVTSPQTTSCSIGSFELQYLKLEYQEENGRSVEANGTSGKQDCRVYCRHYKAVVP